MDRSQKEKLVADFKTAFDESTLLVVTQPQGLTVEESSDLRGKMREAGANFKVTKNRLARLALDGTKFEGLAPLFSGPTAIAFSKDPVAAARIAVAYAKDNEKLTILGGSLDDEELGVDGVKNLASLPSLDELRGKIVGMISTPATRIAGVLQAPAGQLARVVGAYGATDGTTGEAA